MNPQYSAQDVLRCHMCETPVPPLFCDLCHVNLCKDCAGKHLLDESKQHNVVPIKQKWSSPLYPKCPIHTTKQFELYCEPCCIPICVQCVSSTDHRGHTFVDMLKKYSSQNVIIKRDLEELEESIYPKYQKFASEIPDKRVKVVENSKRLTATLNIQGKVLHREIDRIVHDIQSEIDILDSKLLLALDKEEDKMKQTMTEISKLILDLKNLVDSTDLFLVSMYRSRNNEFQEMPKPLEVPIFFPGEINKEQLLLQFGYLSKLPMEDEHSNDSKEAVESLEGEDTGLTPSVSENPLLEVPKLIETVDTGINPLYNVTCQNDEEIWASGQNKLMKLYKLNGELQKAIQTKSGNWPVGIAVTRCGDLVFTDRCDESINIIKKAKIKRLVKLRGWNPLGVSCTSSDDLLVIIESNDLKEAKVVRYTGSKEIQSIQWDDQGRRLFSSGGSIKYLSENRNFDICVADRDAHAVVVVSADGKLRFRYEGPPSMSQDTFDPVGITTDSKGLILTVDNKNQNIYILDEDGNLCCCISDNVQRPYGVCVDSKDNLFVAELETRKVKKIQYYKLD